MTERKKPVSHEQLKAAIRKFEESGGIIRKLPDQKSFVNQGVSVKAPAVAAIDLLSS